MGNLPEAVAVAGALDFQGGQTAFVNSHLPHQKPRVQALTEPQKQEHKEGRAQRVVWEPTHAGMKREGAVAALERQRVTACAAPLLLTAAGLGNFYLEAA